MAPILTLKARIGILSILLLFTLGYLPVPVSAAGGSLTTSELSTLPSGVDSGKSGEPVFLREIDVKDLVRLPVAQQPHGNSNFVSSVQDYLTEYQTAAKYGSVGLLAHNYLAGQYFFEISTGQEIRLVYSDGSTQAYAVTDMQRYQALIPDSPSSDFIDLQTGARLTAAQLFQKTYGKGSGYLILQTCILAEENPSWGRLFVIAEPVEPAVIH